MTTFNDEFDKNNLDIPDIDTEQSIGQALKDGYKLLETEEKAKNAAKPVNPVLSVTPEIVTPTEKNVYKRAHKMLLDKWLKNGKVAWRAKEVIAMEAGTVPKDYHYDEFVKEVAILGDSL